MRPAVTGFSAQYVSLAFALRRAWDDFSSYAAKPHAGPVTAAMLVAGVEGPRARAITVVVLNAALCESVINTCLALEFSAAAWPLFRQAGPVAKWTTVPQLLWPEYSLPETDPLFRELKALFECRNAIMHANPEVYEGAAKRHKGNVTGWQQAGEIASGSSDLALRLLQRLGRHQPEAKLIAAAVGEHLRKS